MEEQLTWSYDAVRQCWVYAWTFKLESTAWKCAYELVEKFGLQEGAIKHIRVEKVASQNYALIAMQAPSHNPPYRNYKVRKQIIDGKLQCSKCRKWKLLDAFGLSKISSTGYASWCNHCWKLHQLYHITSEEYDEILEKQNHACAICGSPDNNGRGNFFHVDHDHATGIVRGLLCASCNTALGGFKESPAIMRKAIAYLTSHEQISHDIS